MDMTKSTYHGGVSKSSHHGAAIRALLFVWKIFPTLSLTLPCVCEKSSQLYGVENGCKSVGDFDTSSKGLHIDKLLVLAMPCMLR